MNSDCSESDWKAFREVSGTAVDRFCRRALDDVARILADPDGDAFDQLEEVERVTRERRKTLRRDLSEYSRSKLFLMLANMQAHGLLEPGDIARFSAEVQDRLRLVAQF